MTGIIRCCHGIVTQSMQKKKPSNIRVAAVYVGQIMSCHMYCQYHNVFPEL